MAVYMYMRMIGYPADKISILTTYNGQKHLIRDVIQQRCAENRLIGRPHKVQLPLASEHVYRSNELLCVNVSCVVSILVIFSLVEYFLSVVISNEYFKILLCWNY